VSTEDVDGPSIEALTEDTTQIRNQKTTMRPVTVIPTALAETVKLPS
jgi:hypothetical protein